jgi:hypothetical protein
LRNALLELLQTKNYGEKKEDRVGNELEMLLIDGVFLHHFNKHKTQRLTALASAVQRVLGLHESPPGAAAGFYRNGGREGN